MKSYSQWNSESRVCVVVELYASPLHPSGSQGQGSSLLQMLHCLHKRMFAPTQQQRPDLRYTFGALCRAFVYFNLARGFLLMLGIVLLCALLVSIHLLRVSRGGRSLSDTLTENYSAIDYHTVLTSQFCTNSSAFCRSRVILLRP